MLKRLLKGLKILSFPIGAPKVIWQAGHLPAIGPYLYRRSADGDIYILHRVLLLGNGLLAVLEDKENGQLSTTTDIDTAKAQWSSNLGHYLPKNAMSDIDGLIIQLRHMENGEERMVLKSVQNPANHKKDHYQEQFPYLYLRKSTSVANERLETFFAASVEPSEELFLWLQKMTTEWTLMSSEKLIFQFRQWQEKKVGGIEC